MNTYIDADKLIAEIERRKKLLENGTGHPEVMKRVEGVLKGYNSILGLIKSQQQEQPEVNKVEKALSLQIQAYLTTASDELYAPGKPLYTKEHHEGIHECMKMWQKLHQYYFSTKQAHPEVDLEKEINNFFEGVGMPVYWCNDTEQREFCSTLARHFYELGLKAGKEEKL